MELLIVILIILISPFLLYGFLYGLVLVKRLIEKELKAERGLLEAYGKLSSEQRMELDLKRKETEKTGWLTSPSPRQENAERVEVLKEGLIDHPQGGEWETPKDQEPSKPAVVA